MRRKRRNMAVLLLAILLLITAGCGGSGGKESANSAEGNGGDDLSPITFSFFGADANPSWNNMQDEVGKEIGRASCRERV